MRNTFALLLSAGLVAACGDTTMNGADGGGGKDQGAQAHDLAMSLADGGGGSDGGGGGMCQPDPGTDMTSCPCGQGTGTIGVSLNGVCKCYYSCTPNQPGACPCGRSCRSLCTPSDMGCIPNGEGACLPANGPGERCGSDPQGMPYGHGNCQDDTVCVNEDMAGTHAYCMYKCAKQSDCPSGTTCLGLTGGSNACVINSQEMGISLGMSCMPTDVCTVASVCDQGKCGQQCDGPNDTATCGGMKCTQLVDQSDMKTTAYVCR